MEYCLKPKDFAAENFSFWPFVNGILTKSRHMGRGKLGVFDVSKWGFRDFLARSQIVSRSDLQEPLPLFSADLGANGGFWTYYIPDTLAMNASARHYWMKISNIFSRKWEPKVPHNVWRHSSSMGTLQELTRNQLILLPSSCTTLRRWSMMMLFLLISFRSTIFDCFANRNGIVTKLTFIIWSRISINLSLEVNFESQVNFISIF